MKALQIEAFGNPPRKNPASRLRPSARSQQRSNLRDRLANQLRGWL